MRDSTQLHLVTETRRAGNRIVIAFTAVTIAAILYMATMGHFYTERATTAILVTFGGLFAGGWLAVIVNTITYFRLDGLESSLRGDGDASDMMLFAEQRPPAMRLEVQQDSMTRLGRFRFTQSQWRLLAVALADKNWRWTRRNIGAAGIFTSLTAPGVYGEITEDFERLGIVDGGWVSGQGREKLCELADVPLL